MKSRSNDPNRTTGRSHTRPNPPSIRVIYSMPGGELRTTQFSRAFTIGRDEACEICIEDNGVSRQHLRMYLQRGRWWAEDLESANGTYLEGEPIERIELDGTTVLDLGGDGPLVRLIVASSPDEAAEPSPKHAEAHKRSSPGETGAKLRASRGPLPFVILAVVLIAVLAGGIFALVQQHKRVEAMSELAVNIFYDMKNIELQLAGLEQEVSAAASQAWQERMGDRRRQLLELEQRYDTFVDAIRDAGLFAASKEERLILHMARVFGENELGVPEGFVKEVKRYIKKWKSTSRFERAVQRLIRNDYLPFMRKALSDQGLPPQFVYLALQETNFQSELVGPQTRFGHAKGMWQFIPATAERFGLRLGPLKDEATYDPEDERHDFQKATLAAARYIKEIYRTEAQASGLLVMASYNWGEGNIIERLRKLPMNPRERNFWKLLRQHKIPDETYDYVFSIFSAAVIGENPNLFGFELENPLEGAVPSGSS